ncbi:hypothetical protein [Clostridium polynesiense]|uniref:hypothetical protein n=1 Tax=Clostridium polynesiense TaxID=1325933 RepID=UPI0005902599|nr:hypothetical protein [Clostridium polynesiense]
MINKDITLKDLTLLRCTITEEEKDCFKAKDFSGNKYVIMKNEAERYFSVGEDRTFFALKRQEGLMFKKDVYYPITNEQYEYIIKNNSGKNGKTLGSLGISLKSLKSSDNV